MSGDLEILTTTQVEATWPFLQRSLAACQRCLPPRSRRHAEALLFRLAVSWLSMRIDRIDRRLSRQ